MNRLAQNVIKHQVGLLNLATEPGNVSRACKVMGFSRDRFYRSPSDWLAYYCEQRTHQGKVACGRTLMQTLVTGTEAWGDKITAANGRT